MPGTRFAYPRRLGIAGRTGREAMTREDRAHELRALRNSDPQRLIALYRAATGKDEFGQLPAGLSFASMVDAVLQHEFPSDKTPHAAGMA